MILLPYKIMIKTNHKIFCFSFDFDQQSTKCFSLSFLDTNVTWDNHLGAWNWTCHLWDIFEDKNPYNYTIPLGNFCSGPGNDTEPSYPECVEKIPPMITFYFPKQ